MGVNHDVQVPGDELFFSAVHLHGGPAPVRRFLPRQVELIANGDIEPGKVFDLVLPLDDVTEGYRAMEGLADLVIPQQRQFTYVASGDLGCARPGGAQLVGKRRAARTFRLQ